MEPATAIELQAAAFRHLLEHLRARPQLQNIELMNLADFCRNCLAKWLVEAAAERGLSLDYEAAREQAYGMPYSEWKAHHQRDATPEQLAAFEQRQNSKS